MTKKSIWLFARIVIVLGALGAGIFLLFKYEYFKAMNSIDNFSGVVPIALTLVFAGGIGIFLWIKHSKKTAILSVSLAAVILLSALLFPTALHANWWLSGSVATDKEAKPDLTVYAPFTGSKTAQLEGQSSLNIASELPLLDGATALYPVYAAFAQAVYEKEIFSQDRVICTNTSGAYKALTEGKRDVIFVAGASEKQIAAAKAAGADLSFTPIGKEAFVFLVGNKNPVDNLSYQQIRNIYSGKTARWSTLGWKEGGDIIAFQRPEGSGSQTGLQNVMKNLPIHAPRPLPDESLIGSNSLMQQISVEWKGVQPALGYSYKFYATTMYANPEAKLLSIDGVAPSKANIRNGTYRFVTDFYAVTNGEAKGNSKRLIDWILSPQGQELIEKTGYTSIH